MALESSTKNTCPCTLPLQVGDKLGERFFIRMKAWIRYYVLCCETPKPIGEDPLHTAGQEVAQPLDSVLAATI